MSRNEFIKADSVYEEHLSPALKRKINGISDRVTKVVERLSPNTNATDKGGAGVSVHAIANYAITTSGTVTIDGVETVAGRKYLLNAQQPATDNGVWIARDAAWERSKDTLFSGMLISVLAGDKFSKSVWMLATPSDSSITAGAVAIGFKEVIPERGVSLPLVRAMISKALCKVDIGAAVFQAEMAPGLWLCTQGTDEVIPFQVQSIRSKYVRYDAGVIRPLIKGYYRVTAKFYDENTNPNTLQKLKILGKGNLYPLIYDLSERDRFTGLTCDLFGERLVYCNGVDDTIKVCINHNGAVANTYNNAIGGFHNSYCIVTYQGDSNAGFLA